MAKCNKVVPPEDKAFVMQIPSNVWSLTLKTPTKKKVSISLLLDPLTLFHEHLLMHKCFLGDFGLGSL